jgi:hypothetical protein
MVSACPEGSWRGAGADRGGVCKLLRGWGIELGARCDRGFWSLGFGPRMDADKSKAMAGIELDDRN